MNIIQRLKIKWQNLFCCGICDNNMTNLTK
jgi:hypothetical protein